MKFLTVPLMLILSAAAQAATTTYAATDVGPYVSTDRRRHLAIAESQRVQSSFQGVPKLALLAVDPVNPSTIYMLGSVSGTTAFFTSMMPAKPGPHIDARHTRRCQHRGSGVLAGIDPVATNYLYLRGLGPTSFSAQTQVRPGALPRASATRQDHWTGHRSSDVRRFIRDSQWRKDLPQHDFGNT